MSSINVMIRTQRIRTQRIPTQRIPAQRTPAQRIPTQRIPTQRIPTQRIPTQGIQRSGASSTFAFSLLVVLSGTAVASVPRAEAPPNLLIIQTDEHNFRTLGCYREQLSPEQALMWGDAVVETPHIDRLADEGATALRFYAASPVCSPSRATFITGRYPHQTDVIGNDIPLRDGLATFATVLRDAGYATGFAGKWHLDGTAKPGFAPPRGFGFDDRRFMFNRGHWKNLSLTEDGARVVVTDKKGRPGYGVGDADAKSFTTDFLADRTMEFIREHQQESFCYYLSFHDPHGPDRVRAPYDTMYSDQEYAPPRTHELDPGNTPAWAPPQKGNFNQSRYYGMVKCIDDNVGRILALLDELSLSDRTVVVFTSDHGDLRGEHHRQNKGVPYEASAKVPFIIRFPGRIAPRTLVAPALSTIDFAPTVLALLNESVERPAGMTGRDVSAAFTSDAREEEASKEDVPVILRSAGKKVDGWIAAVTQRHKLVIDSSGPPWLFDLATDPDERMNALSDGTSGDVAARLAEAIRDYGDLHGDPRVSLAHVRATLDSLISEDG